MQFHRNPELFKVFPVKAIIIVVILTETISYRFSPIGVGSIIASKLAAMQNIIGTAENLGLFVTAVIIATILYGAVIVTIIYVILSRRNPLRLLSCTAKAMLTSFGTSSR